MQDISLERAIAALSEHIQSPETASSESHFFQRAGAS